MEKIIVKGYLVEIAWDQDDSIFVAKAVALPGCMTHGATLEEAAAEMKVAIDAHLTECRERGESVPPAMAIYA